MPEKFTLQDADRMLREFAKSKGHSGAFFHVMFEYLAYPSQETTTKWCVRYWSRSEAAPICSENFPTLRSAVDNIVGISAAAEDPSEVLAEVL